MSRAPSKIAPAIFAAACVLVTPILAEAQAVDFRGKQIRLIVGAATGGGYDANGRVVARHIGRHIPGEPSVVVENMPGAGSVIMMNYLYNSAPKDGSVWGLPTGTAAVEPRLKVMAREGANVRFDPNKMRWLGTPAQQPQVLFVWHEKPFHTVDDLAKQKSIMGATSAATDNAILPTLMNQMLGTKMEVVTGYRGTADILLAMERGEADGHVALLANLTVGKPDWFRDKKARILVQFGAKRSAEIPDVPTAIELAKTPEDKELLTFYSLKYDMAYPIGLPPGVPANVVSTLQKAFDATMTDAGLIKDARQIGLELSPLSGSVVESLMLKIDQTPQSIIDRLVALTTVKK
ncbi:MAG: Bug family tripartite tricarboxylate transporter substrate binding protein [Beijerinckiaceae bacterium]